MASQAQSQERYPVAPSPAGYRCQARRGSRAAIWRAGQGPAPVVTWQVAATASTYPIWRRSRSARRPGSAPYTSSPVTRAAGTPASSARPIMARASLGLVANTVPSGMPAAAHRPLSAVQDRGRYSSRPVSACPRRLAQDRNTATWQFSTRPAVPEYWRCTPALAVPFLTSPVSSLDVASLINYEHGIRAAQVLDDIPAQVIADRISIPPGPGQQVLHPVREDIPGQLGDRPAVLAPQARQKPQHERPGPASRLHPGEPPRDPLHQLVEVVPPPGRVYAEPSGHRRNIMSRHKP